MPSKDNIQNSKADLVALQLNRLYLSVIDKITKGAVTLNKKEGKVFSIDDYPYFKRQVNSTLNDLTNKTVSVIEKATEEQWLEAYNKNIGIADPYLKRGLLTDAQKSAYLNKNLKALQTFQKRKINGLKLSDRVWKYSNQYKGEIEMSIDVALAEGMSAQKLSQEVRKYLQEPERLFRRVRDKHGNLQLSKMAQKYRPGTGVYRSSYKNAMRLARTEVNMAYRASDYEKYQQFDFVVGYEVKRSNRVFGCSVCEGLKGKYPKHFRFLGWHPQCRCYTVPILNKIDKFIEQQKAILDGKTYKPSNIISSLPKNFQNWYKDNLLKIKTAKSTPYFINDNQKIIDKIKIVTANIVDKAKNAKTYLYNKITQAQKALYTPKKADEVFRGKSGEVWSSITKEERRAIYEYTGSSYDVINKGYYGTGEIDPRGKIIENIIEKSYYDETVVVRRGVDDYTMNGYFGKNFHSLKTEEDFKKMIGIKGEMKSFTSTGCAIEKGFNKKYELIIECPPKTKMIYGEPFSRHGLGDEIDWDGKKKQTRFSSEQEIIIQKGKKIEVIDIRKNPDGSSYHNEIQVLLRIIE